MNNAVNPNETEDFARMLSVFGRWAEA